MLVKYISLMVMGFGCKGTIIDINQGFLIVIFREQIVKIWIRRRFSDTIWPANWIREPSPDPEKSIFL